MASLADNPFATLTIVVAPAILTNASSVLSLGTGNRIARVVDRTRILNGELALLPAGSPLRAPYERQLTRLGERAHLLLRALRFLYTSIGSFAAAALISIVGSLVVTTGAATMFASLAALALVSGTIGVAGLVVGCSMMVRETGLAVTFLSQEMDLVARPPNPSDQSPV